MEPSPDELAGVADLFGGLTREEFQTAFENLSARNGTAFDADSIEDALEDAISEYYLLEVDHTAGQILAAGPAALPTLPEHGADLPHMMSMKNRDVDSDRLAEAMASRLDAAIESALQSGDTDRIQTLLDVCYDAETWADVDVQEPRERLQSALESL